MQTTGTIPEGVKVEVIGVLLETPSGSVHLEFVEWLPPGPRFPTWDSTSDLRRRKTRGSASLPR